MRRWSWLLAIATLLGFALCMPKARAAQEYYAHFMLFDGSTPNDSAEHASPWIPVRYANRVIIRTYTNNTQAWTTTDSQYVDSIGVFKVLFSDSVSFIGRDSSGTIVPIGTYTSTANAATQFPVCADSTVITGVRALAADTTIKQMQVVDAPIGKVLGAKFTGSGTYTFVVPALPSGSTGSTWGDGSIPTKYMRIRYTPYGGFTLTGKGFTAGGRRALGLHGLAMMAQVVYRNKD